MSLSKKNGFHETQILKKRILRRRLGCGVLIHIVLNIMRQITKYSINVESSYIPEFGVHYLKKKKHLLNGGVYYFSKKNFKKTFMGIYKFFDNN